VSTAYWFEGLAILSSVESQLQHPRIYLQGCIPPGLRLIRPRGAFVPASQSDAVVEDVSTSRVSA